MKIKTLLILLLITLTACTTTQPATEEVFPTLSTEEAAVLLSTQLPPTPDYTYHPFSVRTGISDIDAALAALEAGDPAKLSEQFIFVQTTCTTLGALGGPPPCREGQAEGTEVQAFPSLGGEGSFILKEELGQWQGLKVAGVYAIYEISNTVFSDANYPAGKYGIALVGTEGAPSAVLHINGGITRIDYIFDAFGSTLFDVIKADVASMVLAPLSP